MNAKILTKFESLFENDDPFSNLKIVNEYQKKFAVETNNQLLESVYFEPSQDQWTILFSRLNLFFELGFHVINNNIISYFYLGECFNKQNQKMKFKIPQSSFFNVLKTDGISLLRKMNLQDIHKAKKMSALLIRLDQNNTFILFTDLAEPWLKLRCESLHRCLLNHDYFTNDNHG